MARRQPGKPPARLPELRALLKGKARQGRATQGKARQGKARQGKARPRDPKTVKLEAFDFCAALPVNFPGLEACLEAFFIP